KQVGIEGLSVERGLELFDTAMGLDDPALVPIQLDLPTLRKAADNLPELFHTLAPPTRRRSAAGKADPGGLRRTLETLNTDGQHALLLELVTGLAAGLLGYQDAAGIDPERDFLELGFDSLMAMELRSALSEATGLRLPSMVVFDHKSASALARFLLAEISAAGPVPGAASVDGEPPAGTGAGGPSGAASDTLSQLFREALQNGPLEKAMTMLNAVAETRPAFTSAADIPALPVPVRLMEGPAGRTRLICLSTPMATSGVYQHAHIANHFKGIRGVAGIPLPGFVRGDSLPATNDAAAEVLAEAALEAADGERFVLAGYSAGGILAHAAAMHLEQRGVRPVGVVLMDSYLPDGSGTLLDGLLEAMLEMEETFDGFDSARLSSMGRYSSMLASFPLEGLQAPVLFLQCARPFPGADTSSPGNAWQAAPWNGNQTVRGVGANHFTMLEEGAPDCARAIEEWLGTLD
ncbi:MAG TPA: phosphopantetheine-binding protein, partial [Streptomyces sp.]